MHTAPKVLIVILNYCAYGMTLEIVDTLHQALSYPRFDILVVDNASTNESDKVLRANSEEKGYQYVQSGRNAGYAAGNNIGIRYAVQNGYDYTWVINNDIVLKDADVLTNLVETMESRPRVAAVSPRVYDIEGKESFQFFFRPTVWDMSFGIIGSKKKRAAVDASASREIYRPQGCCMLLRNSAMQEIDYLDEETFLYCEEPILAERLLEKGYTCFYVAEARIVHLESSTIGSLHKRFGRAKMILKSENIYMKKYRRWNAFIRILCCCARGAVVLCRG